jgi:hypothetical protein
MNRPPGPPSPDEREVARDPRWSEAEPKLPVQPSAVRPQPIDIRRESPSASRNAMVWPLAATALVGGAAFFAFMVTQNGIVIIMAAVVAAVMVLAWDIRGD